MSWMSEAPSRPQYPLGLHGYEVGKTVSAMSIFMLITIQDFLYGAAIWKPSDDLL